MNDIFGHFIMSNTFRNMLTLLVGENFLGSGARLKIDYFSGFQMIKIY